MNRFVLAIGAGVVAVGAVAASAATLGGLNAQSLGSDTATVDGCQTTAMDVVWNAPTYNNNKYLVNGLSLDGLEAACESHNYKLTVSDNTGTALTPDTVSTTPADHTTPFNVALTAPVDSSQVYNVTLTIYGD